MLAGTRGQEACGSGGKDIGTSLAPGSSLPPSPPPSLVWPARTDPRKRPETRNGRPAVIKFWGPHETAPPPVPNHTCCLGPPSWIWVPLCTQLFAEGQSHGKGSDGRSLCLHRSVFFTRRRASIRRASARRINERYVSARSSSVPKKLHYTT